MGFGKDGKGAIIRESSAATLGAMNNDAGTELAGPALEEDFRILKTEGNVKISNLTTTQGAGLELWFANGELSVGEFLECIDLDGPLDRNDRVSQERAERFVKFVSAIVSPIVPTEVILYFLNETGGPQISFNPRWTFSNPEGWSFFLVNRSGSQLTTGASLEVTMTHYGVWVT